MPTSFAPLPTIPSPTPIHPTTSGTPIPPLLAPICHHGPNATRHCLWERPEVKQRTLHLKMRVTRKLRAAEMQMLKLNDARQCRRKTQDCHIFFCMHSVSFPCFSLSTRGLSRNGTPIEDLVQQTCSDAREGAPADQRPRC